MELVHNRVMEGSAEERFIVLKSGQRNDPVNKAVQMLNLRAPKSAQTPPVASTHHTILHDHCLSSFYLEFFHTSSGVVRLVLMMYFLFKLLLGYWRLVSL